MSHLCLHQNILAEAVECVEIIVTMRDDIWFLIRTEFPRKGLKKRGCTFVTDERERQHAMS